MSDRKMAFCMLTTFYPPYHFGGDAMYVYRLSNELAKRGHRVVVAHCVDAYKLFRRQEPRAVFEHHPNVEVVRLRSRWGAASPLVTYFSGQPGLKTPMLDALFRRERFDVVHFHNVSLIGGPGLLRYGEGAVKLYHMHEHWLVCPMHVLWKYNREPCITPDCVKCTLSFHRPPQLWRYTDLLTRQLEHVDLFLSPSRFTIAQHRLRGFKQQIRHLPYFVPLAETSRDEDSARPPAERPYFLFVGRLERLKGVQTLIERFREYRLADLLIAGDGEYGAELRRHAQDLSHVRFIGRVHPAQLRALYAGAVAVLVPSVGYETFGMVSIEAFAQRTPAIVRALGGLPEAIEDSGGGFVYRTDDELVAAMEALRQNPRLRADMGERGFRGFLSRWADKPHLESYFDAIREAGELRHGALAAQ